MDRYPFLETYPK